MDWKEIKVIVDGEEVCNASKTDKGMQINCSDKCKDICKDMHGKFPGGCC